METKKKSSHWYSLDSDDCPCERTFHSSIATFDKLYIFGGFDGANRRNDLYCYDPTKTKWAQITTEDLPPSPRDRHTAVLHGNSIFIFGGFDGHSRVNDFYEYNIESNTWQEVLWSENSHPPTPRYSHTSVVWEDWMYVFGGYDGVYKNDFHKFNFITNTWTLINGNLSSPNYPSPRYRTAATVYKDRLFLFGGHDGVKQLNDFYCHNFTTEEWTSLNLQNGVLPSPRDSHAFVTFQNSIYLFGGSTGQAVNDFYEYKIEETRWNIVNQCGGISPTPRFCHSAAIIGSGLYIFGGYDGHARLKDFKVYQFENEIVKIQPSTLNKDLLEYVNSKLFSDISITVEGTRILHAHRLFLKRAPYFSAMLEVKMKESEQKIVNIENISYDTMLQVLRYLYTDDCEINLSSGMDLFVAADMLGIERLKQLCEQSIVSSITVENATTVFLQADMHHANGLREKALYFILSRFDEISKTQGFEQLARTNVELIIELLKKR